MRVVAIVQARLGSTRLPNKVLADIGGRPMLLHVLERVWATPDVDVVALALPEEERDAWREVLEREVRILAGFGERHSARSVLPIFFGPTDDVLTRFYIAAAGTNADIVMRVTADCPLWAPDFGSRMLKQVVDGHCDFATNDVSRSGYPDGTDVQIFTRALLEHAVSEANSPYDREHVCPWMERHARHAERSFLQCHGVAAGDLKVSVDTEEDLARVRAIHAELRAGELSLQATLEAAERADVWVPPCRRSDA